jgi:hypothetical protein
VHVCLAIVASKDPVRSAGRCSPAVARSPLGCSLGRYPTPVLYHPCFEPFADQPQ